MTEKKGEEGSGGRRVEGGRVGGGRKVGSDRGEEE
jgi:hypothetical protein